MKVEWIDATKQLPDINEVVEVRGKYTANNTGVVLSWIDSRMSIPFWNSEEWRGFVGITLWRKYQGKKHWE